VTGTCLKLFADHTRPVYALAFSPNGRLFATGGGDGYLHVYSVKVGQIHESNAVIFPIHIRSNPQQTKEKKFSWFAGADKPGVFELDWQTSGHINRIAVALEGWNAAVVNIPRIPALKTIS
jgi:transducin (beta)-like 1